MVKLKDPIGQMTRPGARYYAGNLHYLMAAHGMNYWKYLCLQWQSTTGKCCTKRRHMADEYKRAMECEVTLTECLTIAVQGGGQTCKKLSEILIDIHKVMGCQCPWRPIMKPPLSNILDAEGYTFIDKYNPKD